MDTSSSTGNAAIVGTSAGVRLTGPARWLVGAAAIAAGAAALLARAIPDPAIEIGYGVALAAGLLGLTVALKRSANHRGYWELAFVLFVFAVVQVLNNALPPFVQTTVLHDQPNSGDPLASTVSGTVVIQLFETLLAVLPIIVLTRMAGLGRDSIYLRFGRAGRSLLAAIIVFGVVYAVIGLSPAAHRYLPIQGTMTLDRYLALTPALLVLVVSNGLQEELLFRGLFLRRYTAYLGVWAGNVAQAVVFSVAHAGVTYTPNALLFIVVSVLPLGLVAGYLMRRSDGIAAPLIFHAALDIPIYLAFLTFAS